MKAVEGWKNKKLIELAEYINGYAFKPDDWEKDGLPIIRIEQLKNPDAPTDYYSGKLPTKNIVENGDLIFSWSASLFLRIWRHDRAALNQHLFRVVEREGIDRVFLKLFIEFYLPELTKASHGSTMQHITRKELDRFNAPFPTSKPEQTKIAEILSTVDQAIEQTEALIAKQQRIKTGLMQDLLTRGIDEYDNLRSEQAHEFKDSPLGRIPVGWEVVSLSYFVKRLDAGISVNSDDKPCGSGQIGVLKTSALNKGDFLPEQNKTVLQIEENRVRVSPTANTILISRMNTPDLVGESGFVDKDYPHLFLPDRIWMTIFQDGKEKAARWLSFVMTSPHARSYITLNATGTSGSMKNLPKASLFKMPLRAPTDPEEQLQIARLLECQNIQIGQMRQSLEKIRFLKTALMQDLLTGKKRVTALLNETEKITS